MLHILLLILKIILWVVLAILSLVLLVLLLVLFAPISYRAKAVIDDNKRVKAKLRFLMVSASVFYDKAAKKSDVILRVFGIRLGGRKNEEKDKKKDKKKRKAKKAHDEIDLKLESDISEKENISDKESKEAITSEVTTDTTDTSDTTDEKADAITNDGQKNTAKEPPDISDKKPKKEKKIEKKAVKGSKIDNLKKKTEALKKFWELECTVKTRTYLKKYIISIIRHIGPRHIKGYLVFGFDDPATTGNVTGYLSLMPFAYQKNFRVTPDFYNKVLKCDVKLKGHMFIAYFLRIALNINIWRTVKAAKKYMAD